LYNKPGNLPPPTTEKKDKTMAIDYDNEERVFLKELDDGKYKIDHISNAGSDYQQKEDRDLEAFGNYLKSDSFKSLNIEASK
jgi:hypothetical protein